MEDFLSELVGGVQIVDEMNVGMADKLHESLQEENEKACAIYENGIVSLASEEHRSISLDPRVERGLMNAAIRCGRSELAKMFLNASPSDLAKYINMVRNCAAENIFLVRGQYSKPI